MIPMAMIRPILAVTLPIALPIAMSTLPSPAAIADTKSSGSVVAMLTTVDPTISLGIPDTSDKNLEEQAHSYRVITDIMLNHDNCTSMVIWGLKDNNSWRESSNPLLFTAQLDKKPAYFAVRSAMRHRYLVETGIHPIRQTKTTNDNIYNIAGQKVSGDYQGIVIIDGKKILNKTK